MSIRLYIFLLFIILFLSASSVLILYWYMNPLPNPQFSLTLMAIGLFLSIASFLGLFFFFFKKIYYRGDITLATMHSSIRQGLLTSISLLFIGTLLFFKIQETHIIITVALTLLCIEIMFQAID